GACQGLVYRLPAADAAHELKLLWNREMVVGSYSPRWARVEAAPCTGSHGCTEELRALVFVVNREHPNYAGKLPLEEVVTAIASAVGHIGSSADYLFHTVDALATHGLRDAHLEALRRKVERAVKPSEAAKRARQLRAEVAGRPPSQPVALQGDGRSRAPNPGCTRADARLASPSPCRGDGRSPARTRAGASFETPAHPSFPQSRGAMPFS